MTNSNSIKRYKSVDELLDEMRQERKNHPIKYFFRDLYHKVLRIIEVPFDLYREIKYFIQRGIKGYSCRDVWNFDFYLATLIKTALIDLQKNKMGYPSEITEEEWNIILTKIIRTFHFAELIIDGKYLYIPSYKFTEKEYNKLSKFAKENDYVSMTKEDSLKFEEGFDLFKKYYFNLWD